MSSWPASCLWDAPLPAVRRGCWEQDTPLPVPCCRVQRVQLAAVCTGHTLTSQRAAVCTGHAFTLQLVQRGAVCTGHAVAPRYRAAEEAALHPVLEPMREEIA